MVRYKHFMSFCGVLVSSGAADIQQALEDLSPELQSAFLAQKISKTWSDGGFKLVRDFRKIDCVSTLESFVDATFFSFRVNSRDNASTRELRAHPAFLILIAALTVFTLNCHDFKSTNFRQVGFATPTL